MGVVTEPEYGECDRCTFFEVVREEHFRDVNRRDIESLAPKDAHCMECDADYLIPGLGRHYWHGFQEEDKEEERK